MKNKIKVGGFEMVRPSWEEVTENSAKTQTCGIHETWYLREPVFLVFSEFEILKTTRSKVHS